MQQGATEEAPEGDPEVFDSTKFDDEPSVWNSVSHALVLIFVPWILFTLIMLPFALFYSHWPCKILAWVLFAIGLVLAIGWIVLKENPNGRPRYLRFLGLLCLFSTFLAMAMGFYCYYRYTYPYQVYKGSRWYTSVRPSENPAAKSDAGLLTFSSSSVVDTTKGVGFKNTTRQTCVAPIIGIASNGYVGYFAAGFGKCCLPRGRFSCGDVTNPNAHGGVVLRDIGLYTAAPQYQLKAAAKQAGATYGLTVPDNPVFVKWSARPREDRLQFWYEAVSYYLVAISAFLALCVACGLAVFFGPTSGKRSKRQLKLPR